MAPIYQASNGNIVIEAEDSTDGSQNRGSTSWATSTAQSGYVGSSALLSSGSYTTSTGWISSSAERRYEVWFDTPGMYYVYLRMYATGSGANSASIGLDGNEAAEAYNIQTTTYNSWVWATSNNASQPATITVTSVGLHMLRLYVREAGVRIDRIGLTLTSGGAVFSGNGPAATARSTPPAGGAWSSITATRQFVDRTRKVTIATTAAAEGYLTVPLADGSTNYYSGPLASDGITLTLAASQSAAASSPAPLPTNGVWRLPTLIEARQFTLTHRSPAATSYGVSEYYPRRHVEADDIDVENLRAVSAYTGNLFVDGVLSIAATGGLYGGTGTFSAPATGIRWSMDAGLGTSTMTAYRNGSVSSGFDSNGSWFANGGRILADDEGFHLLADNTLDPFYVEMKMEKRDGTQFGTIRAAYAENIDSMQDMWFGFNSGGQNYVTPYIWLRRAATGSSGFNRATIAASTTYLAGRAGVSVANDDTNLSLLVQGRGTTSTTSALRVTDSAGVTSLSIADNRHVSIPTYASIGAPSFNAGIRTHIRGQGSGVAATGAALRVTDSAAATLFDVLDAGRINMPVPVGIGVGSFTTVRLAVQGLGSGGAATTAALRVFDGAGSPLMTCYDNGETAIANVIRAVGNLLSFYGANPQARPNITGSRSTGAAFTNLLAAFDTIGLITNSTTA